ncbi:MAG: ATP-binding protein, partial [Burkholderiales bacterium]|nr:ATP-binding protein [Burkholderiales bacterium]
MSLALVRSRALLGLDALAVQVEVQLSAGLPSFSLVGLADTEVKESRERVRAALMQSGYGFPNNKRVVVSLAPADLPKDSGRFDLPIALGILAASGALDPARLDAHEFAGELSLGGDLRPVRGALALALALRREGADRALVLPADSAREAAQVQGLTVLAASDLGSVVRALQPDADGAEVPPLERAEPAPRRPMPPGPDLSEVKGQALAKRALEVAA